MVAKLVKPSNSETDSNSSTTALQRKWNDRKSLAKLISERYFPISHRTLEKWPLAWKVVNGRALCDTDAALAQAEKMLAAAVQIRGGQK